MLVVDDGSDDDTAKISVAYGAKVIKHDTQRGKGEALKTGFARLLDDGFDAILTLDADGQHDPDDIYAFLKAFHKLGEGNDTSRRVGIIIGSRMASRENIPKYRLIPNLVGNFFISLASKRKIEDSQSGMRLYLREVLISINLTTSRYDTETEVLIKAGRAGFSFAFVPIKAIYREDQESHFIPVKDTFLISMVYLRSLFWK